MVTTSVYGFLFIQRHREREGGREVWWKGASTSDWTTRGKGEEEEGENC